jgi:hypothetical protein
MERQTIEIYMDEDEYSDEDHSVYLPPPSPSYLPPPSPRFLSSPSSLSPRKHHTFEDLSSPPPATILSARRHSLASTSSNNNNIKLEYNENMERGKEKGKEKVREEDRKRNGKFLAELQLLVKIEIARTYACMLLFFLMY